MKGKKVGAIALKNLALVFMLSSAWHAMAQMPKHLIPAWPLSTNT